MHNNDIYNKVCNNIKKLLCIKVLDRKFNIITRKNKYFIPNTLENNIIQWYYEILRYPKANRLYKTLNSKLYIKRLYNKVNCYVKACRIY